MLDLQARVEFTQDVPLFPIQEIMIRRGCGFIIIPQVFEFLSEPGAILGVGFAESLWLVLDHQRFGTKVQQAGAPRAENLAMEFPAGIKRRHRVAILALRVLRFLRRRQLRQPIELARGVGERKDGGAFQSARRTLGVRIELANGFERIAEKFQPHRTQRLGRK